MIDRLLAAVAIALIRGYQVTLSGRIGRICLFRPSCSAYAVEALKSRGFRAGLTAIQKRLSCCRGGYSLRLDAEGQVELISHDGQVWRPDEVNPVIAERLQRFR